MFSVASINCVYVIGPVGAFFRGSLLLIGGSVTLNIHQVAESVHVKCPLTALH